jgi:phosphatidylglycerol:prolipoprotein diacylglycerol transferase
VRPTLAIVAGRPISSFRALQYLGAVAALVLGADASRRVGEDPNAFLVSGFFLFIVALISAHAGPAVVSGRLGRRAWLMPREGSGFLFALPIVALLAPLIAWGAGSSVAHFMDSAAVGAAAGVVCGRIGCLLHGCCGGRPTTGRLGILLTDVYGVHARRLPTQLLDAGWAGLVLCGLLVTLGHLPPGVCFVAGATLYGAGRFATEFTRQRRPGGRRLSDAQYVSLGLVAAGSGALLLTVLDSIA